MRTGLSNLAIGQWIPVAFNQIAPSKKKRWPVFNLWLIHVNESDQLRAHRGKLMFYHGDSDPWFSQLRGHVSAPYCVVPKNAEHPADVQPTLRRDRQRL